MVRDVFGSSSAEQMLSNGPVAELLSDMREVLEQRAELLAALERVLAELNESGAWTADDVKSMREAREIGESAIAKARGGK